MSQQENSCADDAVAGASPATEDTVQAEPGVGAAELDGSGREAGAFEISAAAKIEPTADMPEKAAAEASSAAGNVHPAMPRSATLDPRPLPGPVLLSAESGTTDGSTTSDPDTARPRRFAVLAACLALAACLGAFGGALGIAGFDHFAGSGAGPAEAREDIHALQETVTQLRSGVKTLSDNLSGLRASMAASASASNAQIAKLGETLERLERAQAERRAATAPEITGSVPTSTEAKPPVHPPIVEGWVLRRVYDGLALVEGRLGIAEVAPGDSLPGVGRIQDIRHVDGRWVVVTAKGLIVPVR